MISLRFLLFLIPVLPNLSDGVKVNVEGSLSLGKEVVDTLAHYVNKNRITGRRSFDNGEVELNETVYSNSDTIALIVNAAFLCRDLPFCQGDMTTFINSYIIMLTKTIENVFESLIDDIGKGDNQNIHKRIIFEEELGRLIREVKKLLRNANEKVATNSVSYTWTDLIKKINSKFQDRAITFASLRLEGNVNEITEVKNKLTQKLIIATITVERNFENKLCFELDICSKSHECTNALNALLEQMKTVSDERAKEFIKYFYETLPGTNFYYRISDVTGQEFQTILHDMAYAQNIPTKTVLSIVHKSVEDRINTITTKEDKSSGRDVKLVHVILSDLDHFYSQQKKEPFHDFMSDFYGWSKKGGRFSSPLRGVMKDIQNMLSFVSDDLVFKLVHEVRVFMEITVDPTT